MNTCASSSPKLAYFVSAYPAISHTFILREIKRLRELGHTIETASINPPDRALEAMDAYELNEAKQTYCIKNAGALGALTALGYWMRKTPVRLWQMIRQGSMLGHGQRRWVGLAYAVEAAMVARWMDQRQTRHLHVHFGNVGATVGMLVKQLNGCHLSYTIHGPDEFDDVPGQHLALKMASADQVICISQFARAQLMRISHPQHWSKFQLCRLGVSPQQFDFKLRGHQRQASQPAKLLCVGRLTPAKAQVLLVQACAQLRDAGTAFHLTMVGDGPDRARVEQAIGQHQLHSHITMTGALTQSQVRSQFDQADIFVLPSLAEGIPVVLMEAIASGVPCVTTPVNGIPELIQHRQTGLLALPGDVESLTQQLASLIDAPLMGDTLATEARDKLLAEFDLELNVQRLSQIFQQLPARN